jgi:hypothetical protein
VTRISGVAVISDSLAAANSCVQLAGSDAGPAQGESATGHGWPSRCVTYGLTPTGHAGLGVRIGEYDSRFEDDCWPRQTTRSPVASGGLRRLVAQVRLRR